MLPHSQRVVVTSWTRGISAGMTFSVCLGKRRKDHTVSVSWMYIIFTVGEVHKCLKTHSLADKLNNVIKQINSIPFLFSSSFLDVDEGFRKYSLMKEKKIINPHLFSKNIQVAIMAVNINCSDKL